MDKTLLEQYGLNMERQLSLGTYEAFLYRNIIYTIIPTTHLEQEEIYEQKQMSDYLLQKGDIHVATIVPSRDGAITTSYNDQDVLLLRCPNQNVKTPQPIGRELAKLHKRGRTLPFQITRSNRIGQWKLLWEKRLDQMELFWKQKVQDHPTSYFEKLFVDSFSYYIGLTENAIQYLVDTELDDVPKQVDAATICHQRFTKKLWEEMNFIKIPTTWVFDHNSRDLAEYIRDDFFSNYRFNQKSVSEFLEEYRQYSSLSTFSWRLLYARLLFPLHYFECIEGYYLSNSDEERHIFEQMLLKHLDNSNRYEQFLSTMYQLLTDKNPKGNVPKLTWLP